MGCLKVKKEKSSLVTTPNSFAIHWQASRKFHPCDFMTRSTGLPEALQTKQRQRFRLWSKVSDGCLSLWKGQRALWRETESPSLHATSSTESALIFSMS